VRFCRAKLAGAALLWPLLASAVHESRVVKIVSARCGDTREFRGSGLLFQDSGRAYVLTSDHVVLHSNDGYCHSAGSEEAEYLTSEWGLGLALLKLPKGKPDSSWLTLADLAGQPVAKGEKLVVTGFPFGSFTLVEDGRGEVLLPASPSQLFALIPTLIETIGAHGEFGMSGGPVFTAGGKFAGVLSHQKLTPDNHLLVVDAKKAGAWAASYFADPKKYLPWFFQGADAQLMQNPEHVWSGNVLFHFTASTPGRGSVLVDYFENAGSLPFPDPTGRVADMVAFVDPVSAMPVAEVAFFRPGEKTRIAIASLTEWLRLLPDRTLTVRASRDKFHSDRWPDLDRHWTAIEDAVLSLGKPVPVLQALVRCGAEFRKIPEHPGGTGPVQVTPRLYTFDWLWARHLEIEALRRDPSWSSLGSKPANAILQALDDIDGVLDVTTL
jgi:hypothetical protein